MSRVICPGPGGARRNQGEPGEARRRSQEQLGGARESQEPGGARRSQEESGDLRTCRRDLDQGSTQGGLVRLAMGRCKVCSFVMNKDKDAILK